MRNQLLLLSESRSRGGVRQQEGGGEDHFTVQYQTNVYVLHRQVADV